MVDFHIFSPKIVLYENSSHVRSHTHTHTFSYTTVLTCVICWSWVLFVILCNRLIWDQSLSTCTEEIGRILELWLTDKMLEVCMIQSIYFSYLFSWLVNIMYMVFFSFCVGFIIHVVHLWVIFSFLCLSLQIQQRSDSITGIGVWVFLGANNSM